MGTILRPKIELHLLFLTHSWPNFWRFSTVHQTKRPICCTSKTLSFSSSSSTPPFEQIQPFLFPFPPWYSRTDTLYLSTGSWYFSYAKVLRFRRVCSFQRTLFGEFHSRILLGCLKLVISDCETIFFSSRGVSLSIFVVYLKKFVKVYEFALEELSPQLIQVQIFFLFEEKLTIFAVEVPIGKLAITQHCSLGNPHSWELISPFLGNFPQIPPYLENKIVAVPQAHLLLNILQW